MDDKFYESHNIHTDKRRVWHSAYEAMIHCSQGVDGLFESMPEHAIPECWAREILAENPYAASDSHTISEITSDQYYA